MITIIIIIIIIIIVISIIIIIVGSVLQARHCHHFANPDLEERGRGNWGSFTPFKVYWGGAILGSWKVGDTCPHASKSAKLIINLYPSLLNHEWMAGLTDWVFIGQYQDALLAEHQCLNNRTGGPCIKICRFTVLTYPMKYWCILQKCISRPLLLSQSGPCRHIGSEMYLQPSRPRMHANSASRENSRFLPQV